MSVFPESGAKPFTQYSDNWSIPEHLADELGRRLGSLVFQQTKLASFSDSLLRVHSPSTVPSVALNVRHRRVIYRDRKIVITRDSKPGFEELTDIFANIVFVKPTKHSPEQEYRFVFELGDGRNIFPPVVDHLLVNPNILTSLQ
jgi:hypothetical protein